MTSSQRNASIRTAVDVPHRIADRCGTDARVLVFKGLDTDEANRDLGYRADTRDLPEATEMLHALGVREPALLGNSRDTADQLTDLGIAVVEMVGTSVHSPAKARYLTTKPLPGAPTFGQGANGATCAHRAVARGALVDGDARGSSARPWWRP